MKGEPSVLLIDDMWAHEKYLRMLGLEDEGWIVEAAIDREVAGATRLAAEKIRAYGGFTFILLDIHWPRDMWGGVKVLHALWRRLGRRRPARKVIILTRSLVFAHEELIRLADILRIPDELRILQLDTEEERQQLKKVLLKLRKDMLRARRGGSFRQGQGRP